MVNGNGVEDLETDGIKGWQEIRENKEKRAERGKPVEHLSFVYMLKTYQKKNNNKQTSTNHPNCSAVAHFRLMNVLRAEDESGSCFYLVSSLLGIALGDAPLHDIFSTQCST